MRAIILSVCFIISFIGVVKTQVSSDSLLVLQLMDRALVLFDNEEKLDSAAIYLQETRKIFLDNKEWDNYIAFSLDLAQKLYRIRYYEEGIQYLQQTDQDISNVRKANDGQRIELKYQMARGYYFTGNYDECIMIVENNLTKLDNTSSDYANHNNLLGAALRRKGLTLKAIEAYEKTLTIRKRELGARHDQVASILNNIGNAYVDLGIYSKALQSLNEALQIREEKLGSDHPDIATILLNLGNLFHFKGDENKAIQYYHRALTIFEASPAEYDLRIADIFNNLAFSYKSKGAFQESNAYHQQAIQKYQSLSGDYSVEIGNVHVNWSNLAELQKDHDKEIELNKKAIALYTQTLAPGHPRVVAATNNLGIAYANSGDYEGALAELKSLIPLIKDDAGQRAQYANLHNDIADVYYKTGKYGEAKSYNLIALNIQQELFGNKSYKLAYTYNSLAKIEEAEGDREEALQYLQQALAANHADFEAEYVDAAPSPNGFYKYDYFVESLMHKARLMRAGADQTSLFQAKFLYEVADSVLTLVRDELLSSEDKIRLSEQFYALSQAAITNAIQLAEVAGSQRFLEDAFAFSEKSKSNVLAQSIAANQAKAFAGIPDTLIALEDQLQSDINFYKLQLAEQPDSLERILYQNELFAAQQDYRNLLTRLENEFLFYHQLKYDRTVPRVRAIQFALPENTAMVSYFIGDSVLFSFVITKDDFKVHRSPVAQDFYEKQVGFRKSITNKLNEDYVALAYELRQVLLPFDLEKDITSLIMIPDGTLSKLPFEALLTKKINIRNEINFSRLPYLVNDYEINYALSATLYYQERSTTSTLDKTSEGLLACAPVFAEPQDVGYFASGVRDPLAAMGPEATRTMTLDGKYVSALPATADEVTLIAEVFQKKGQRATTYLFQNANEHQLKQGVLRQSRYIHIATHGFINEAQPDLSGLLLFPDTTAQEDHILYSGEVYNLNLNADLVVLSACETGLGKIASGEGLLGLSRAFFYAGAGNLVVSLWKVQDRATADLMVSFYQEHLEGKSAQFATPLRQAKLNMIRTEEFSHPYYWSAFVLIGQ